MDVQIDVKLSDVLLHVKLREEEGAWESEREMLGLEDIITCAP